MPSVSIDSKSFLLQASRAAASRVSIAAAGIDPCLIDPSDWAARFRGARHAGFNAVMIRAPWLLHEPTIGRHVFTGACDVRRAVELAGEAGLMVMLRIGPCVGGGFARGGLPGWIHSVARGRVREASPEFLGRVTQFWRAIAPQFVDLQATRSSNGMARPVIAVGIEDDWRCLDDEVGGPYFGALVRFAREVGIEVPLFTANNCWYSHEGLIDAWSGADAAIGTADELRQVHPDAPPMLLHAIDPNDASASARIVAESVAARADFAFELGGTRHLGATSARGCAQRSGRDLFPLRRALVFASTFGEILASMVPDIEAVDAAKRSSTTTLRGTSGEQVSVVVDKSGARFFGSGLSIGGSRLEQCTGSLVALLGDIVVVSGAPRARLSVKVDGSTVSVTVPAEGSAPKVTKIRGLRIAVVSDTLADGVGVAADAIEFVDRQDALLARIARGGSAERTKNRDAQPLRRRTVELAPVRCVVEHGLVDGAHARLAAAEPPLALGDYGVDSMHGYYCARVDALKRRDSRIWIDGRGVFRSTVSARRPKGTTHALEIRTDFMPQVGSHRDERAGIVGPMLEVAPLKGVKCAVVDLPRFDASRLGRFIWGYEARVDGANPKTLRWMFAARSTPVIVEMPRWWIDDGHAAAGHALRLNGQIIVDADWSGRTSVLLDGALLSPMRPRKLAKGEKPPKAKEVKLEPGANELLLDLDPRSTVDRRLLDRLAKDISFHDVRGPVSAQWSFARVEPPASWTASVPAPRKPIGAPAWFRTAFSIDSACTVEISCDHTIGGVGTLLVNGASVMVLDGESGVRAGSTRKPRLIRSVAVPRSLLRTGENEICIFEPDGAMPAISVARIG